MPTKPRTMAGDISEILDRTRRIETRITGMIKGEHFTHGERPTWDAKTGIVQVPSTSVALDEVLGVIPLDYSGQVEVKLNDRRLCVFA